MITSFTPEQEELLVEVKDEWLDRFFSLSFDEEKTRELINWIYEEFLEVEKPHIFVLDSPLSCQLAANALKGIVKIEQVYGKIDDKIYEEFEREFRGLVNRKVDSDSLVVVSKNVVTPLVESADDILNSVKKGLSCSLGDMLFFQMRDRVASKISRKLWIDAWTGKGGFSDVLNRVYTNVCKPIEKEVREKIRDQTQKQIEDGVDYDDLFRAFVDVNSKTFDQIYHSACQPIKREVEARIRGQVKYQVDENVESGAWEKAYWEMRGIIFDDVVRGILYKINRQLRDQIDGKSFESFKAEISTGIWKNIRREILNQVLSVRDSGLPREVDVRLYRRDVRGFREIFNNIQALAKSSVENEDRESFYKVKHYLFDKLDDNIKKVVDIERYMKVMNKIFKDLSDKCYDVGLRVEREVEKLLRNDSFEQRGERIDTEVREKIRGACSKLVFGGIVDNVLAYRTLDRILNEIERKIRINVTDSVKKEAMRQTSEKSEFLENIDVAICREVYNKLFLNATNQIDGEIVRKLRNSWQFWNDMWNAAGAMIYASIKDSVDDATKKQVLEKSDAFDNLDVEIYHKIFEQFTDEAQKQIKSRVDWLLENHVWNYLCNRVRHKIMSQIENQVVSDAKKKIKNQKFEYFEASFYLSALSYHWVAFYDYFKRIGVVKHEKFEKYRELIKGNVFSTVALKGVALVSKPPIYIKRNDSFRLHCEDGYAIEFADGWGLYFLNGVNFSKEEFDKFVVGNPKGKEILGIPNQEKRAEVVKIHGYEKIVKDLNLREISHIYVKCKGGRLRHELYWCEELPINLLKVIDNSTLKPYILGVPRDQTEVLSAIAWTFGLTREEYEDREES